MKTTKTPILACVLAACSILAVPTSSAAEQDVTGVWKWTAQGRNGQTREMSMELQQEGSKVTGTMSGRRGPMPITEGSLQGDQLKLTLRRETERGVFTANYKGKVDGGKVDGEVIMKFGDREFTREWSATRVDADPTGSWAWSMDRPDGQVWEATLTIEKTADGLTGKFSRDDSDWSIPIRNVKVQGSILTFRTVFERDGQSMTIHNRAVVKGESMSGKSTREGAASSEAREWKAVRK